MRFVPVHPMFVLVAIVLAVAIAPSTGSAHICWDYGEYATPKLFLECGGVYPTNVREEHGSWHCNFPSGSATDEWGNAFIGFHRQFIFDFDLYRRALGIHRLRVWDAAPNGPVPGNDEEYSSAFTHCFSWDTGLSKCVDDDTQRAAGALCAGCISLPSDLVGPDNLGSYATLGAVGARLQSSNWHGSFHCGAAAAGGGSCSEDDPCDSYVSGVCDDVGNTWEAVHDPAFWMGHKMLDEVARDWQELQAADVVIVIDTSGSMDDNCPGGNADPGETPCKINDAIEAAKMFADLVEDDRAGSTDEHNIGLVTFATTATKHLSGGLVPAAGIVTEGGGDETDLEMALAGLSATGNTSIGDGLDKALEVLATGSNTHQAILLLSDGEENTAPTIQDIRDSGDIGLTQICAIGFGGTFADPDDKLRSLAEDYGGLFVTDADYSSDALVLEKFFVDSFGQIYDEEQDEDPILFLPAGKPATMPLYTQVCGATSRLTYVVGRDRSLGCDLRLIVETPAGDLVDLSDPSVEHSHNESWHFARIPLPYRGEGAGRWCAVGARPQSVITHGFATDSYANMPAGIRLVRHEIHRLFPLGADRVLYFEDGSVTGGSAYAAALQLELAAGTIKTLTQAPTAVDFANLLAQPWDLIVFARQMNPAAGPFDTQLANLLCQGQKALLTDLWLGPAGAPNPVLQCAGTLPLMSFNWTQVIGDGHLVQGILALTNPGYNVFSVGLQPLTTPPGWIAQATNEVQSASIIGNASSCDDQEYFLSALTRGYGKVRPNPLQPRVGLGDQIFASYRMTQSTRPLDGWDAVNASVTLQRPGGAPPEIYPLYDDGTHGDAMPGDNYWEALLPVAAQSLGPHLLHAEFELTEDGCTIRREVESSIMVQPDPQQCLRSLCPSDDRTARPGEAVGRLVCVRDFCRSGDEVEVTVNDSKGWLCMQNEDGTTTPVTSPFLFQLSLEGHAPGKCLFNVGNAKLVVCVPSDAMLGEQDQLSFLVHSLGDPNQEDLRCETAVNVGDPATPVPGDESSREFFVSLRSASTGTSSFRFELSLPEEAHARMELYDVRGRLVTTLVDEPMAAGSHYVTWNGVDERGSRVAAGVYYYLVRAGSYQARGSVVLVK